MTAARSSYISGLLYRKPDIAFSRDAVHHLLPWILSLIVALVGLLMAIAVALNSHMAQQQTDLQVRFQIEIPYSPELSDVQRDEALKLLQELDGLEEVGVLPRSEMETMLTPWLGEAASLDSLPVPVIIEVKRKADVSIDFEALASRLSHIADGIVIHRHDEWLDAFIAFNTSARLIMALLALVLVVCMAGMIILTARTSLRLHRDTVRILHRLGATDRYIVQQFAQHQFGVALKAGLVGTLMAALLFVGVYMLSKLWHSPMVPDLALSPMHAVLFGLLPLAVVFVLVIVTHRTVARELRRMH